MKMLHLFAATMALMFISSGCDPGRVTNKSTVASHYNDPGSNEYKDFYQMVAAGADCNDLAWVAGHCETDPSGPWIGNAGSGYCGDAGKSCRFAVALRNQVLGCWQADQIPRC